MAAIFWCLIVPILFMLVGVSIVYIAIDCIKYHKCRSRYRTR